MGLWSIFGCSGSESDPNDMTEPPFDLDSEQAFLDFVSPAYDRLKEVVNITSLMGAQEITSDELCVPVRPAWYDGGHWKRLHRHEWTKGDPIMWRTWMDLYTGILECNRLMLDLKDLNNPMIDAYEAEVIGLRALYYLWLIDLYGNIPLYTDFSTDFKSLSNTSRPKVFEFIEAELQSTLQSLPPQVDETIYGRIQFYVIKAIQAKLYVNAEVYTGTPQWQKAIDACDEIINSGMYRLENDYFDNFITENSLSSEIIFSIPFDENIDESFNIHMASLHPEHQKTYNMTMSPWNGWCAIEEFYHSYEDGDRRKGSGEYPGNFLYGPQFSANGDSLLDAEHEPDDPDGAFVVLSPGITSIDSVLRQEGVRIGKYEVAPGSGLGLSNDFPVFRFADILLMKAEALMKLGSQNEALALVNQVRFRADLPPLTEITADILLEERGRELFAEMHRRTDLIRFGKFGEAWWEKTASEACRTLFPIPVSAGGGPVHAGPFVVQNPCY